MLSLRRLVCNALLLCLEDFREVLLALFICKIPIIALACILNDRFFNALSNICWLSIVYSLEDGNLKNLLVFAKNRRFNDFFHRFPPNRGKRGKNSPFGPQRPSSAKIEHVGVYFAKMGCKIEDGFTGILECSHLIFLSVCFLLKTDRLWWTLFCLLNNDYILLQYNLLVVIWNSNVRELNIFWE